MIQTYNILVTGCGGDIGQSIGKILNKSKLFSTVAGADISDENAGLFIYKKFHKVPPCNSENYFTEIQNLIDKYKIDVILPIAEPELRYFTQNNLGYHINGCPLIIADYNSMKIGFDKLKTANFLKDNSLNFPETFHLTDIDDMQLPLIIKSKNGSGSKNLFIIEDRDEIAFYKKKFPDFIAQELVGDTNNEYTCCVFRDRKKNSRTIILKRNLQNGFSVFGELVENEEIETYILQIADKLNLRGSINIQLRTTTNGPVAFEINPRFSSTVLFRDMMGFKDVIWSIQDRMELEIDDYNKPDKNYKFYKGFNEYIK